MIYVQRVLSRVYIPYYGGGDLSMDQMVCCVHFLQENNMLKNYQGGQLTLHAGLGYAIGEIGYGNGLSGGVGAVVGEVSGEAAYNRDYSKESASKLALLSGALTGF